MKFYEDLKLYIQNIYSPKGRKKYYVETLERFRPITWVAEKNNKVCWKMTDLPSLEVTQTELDEILSMVTHIDAEPHRMVYTDSYFKEGPILNICTSHTQKYDYYYMYLNHEYVIPVFIRVLDVSDRKLCIHEPCNSPVRPGAQALKQINQDLRDSGVIAENKTLTTTLVPEGKSQWKSILKMCVPNQIGWYDTIYKCSASKHCFKADVSSAFPFQLTKAIPTLYGCKIQYDKKLEPTDDYPFVFTYSAGQTFGRVQILNELDTDVDINETYMSQVARQIAHSKTRRKYLEGSYDGHKINLNPIYRGKHYEKFVCIACKKADITLKDVMEMHYQKKLEATINNDEEQKNYEKIVMNALIGYMQKNSGGTLPFISAVVIARQNHRMIEICKELVDSGCIPMYIATDSIVWKFKNDEVATTQKYLGSFSLEYEDCEAYIVQVGAYQIRKDTETKTWCSYLPNNDSKTTMEFGTLPLPKNSQEILF